MCVFVLVVKLRIFKVLTPTSYQRLQSDVYAREPYLNLIKEDLCPLRRLSGTKQGEHKIVLDSLNLSLKMVTLKHFCKH